jgi:DNA-binding response OmpR family regulator
MAVCGRRHHVQSPCPLVLIVDDDVEMAAVLKRMLERAGYVTDYARDGAAALRRVESGDIDLVLLDVMLPDLDGLEVCRRLRTREGAPYLPIVMLTGLTQPAERHAGFVAGADDYVSKPFQKEELLDRVGAWLRTHSYLKQAHEGQRASPTAGGTLLAATLTINHELTRLLMLLLTLLDLWEAGYYAPEDLAPLRSQLRQAATTLASRINALTQSALRDE